MYNNNMNSPKQGTTVVVKKGMGFFTSFLVILGLCCLCSCLSSMWTTAKGVSAVSSAVENSHKKKTVGPIIKDVEVIDVSNESSFESSVEVKGENVTKKAAKIGVYNNCDCESDSIYSVNLSSGANIDGFGGDFFAYNSNPEDQWKCVKGENVTISDYEHSYKGTLNGDKTEGVMNLMEYNLDNNPIKVGCGAGEDFKTEKLKFKWNVRE